MNAVVDYAMRMKDLMSGTLGKVVGSVQKVTQAVGVAQNAVSTFSPVGAAAFNVLNIAGVVKGAVGVMKEFTDANQAQQEAETKLAQVMRNTMDASDAEIQSIKDLTAAQQALGVVGDEIQLAGAQELGTYLEQTESLKKLIPVMNDMVAQQYGYNATQENAVNIATMMGKVMEGQVGALSRYGYKFDEAQEQILKYGTEAQKVATLAEVITESVGGMNEALAQTPEGRMKQLSNTLGDIKEQIGNEATKLGVALLPSIQTLMPAVQTIIGKLSNGVRNITPILQAVIGKAVAGVNWIVGKIDNLKPVLQTVAQPFIKMFDTVRERLKSMATLIEPVKQAMARIGQTIMDFVNRFANSLGGLMDYLQPVIDLVQNTVYPLFESVYQVLGGIVGDIVEFVSKSELLKDIFSFVAKVVSSIGDMLQGLVNVISWIWTNIAKPILEGIEKAYRWIKGTDTVATNNHGATAKIPALPTTQEKETTKQLATIAKNTASNNSATGAAAQAVASKGPKVVNISVGKFFDNIQFNTTTLQESATKIEETVLEVLSRVLIQGAAAI